MEKNDLLKILKIWKEEKLKEVKLPLERTENCLYFSEAEKYVKKGESMLSPSQLEHIDSCQYCKKLIADFQKEIPPRFSFVEALKQAFDAIKETADNLLDKLSLVFQPKFVPVLAPVISVILLFLVISPFLTPSMQLESLQFMPYSTPITRGVIPGRTNLYKISIVPKYDGYVYLFEIKNGGIDLLIQQKITKATENIIPEDKETVIEKEGKLILLLTRKPIKDTLVTQGLILKNFEKNEIEMLMILKKELKRKDLDVKYF
jgi:hypothetical protein